MSKITVTFDAEDLVDQLEDHRKNIVDGQMAQMKGEDAHALDHAIYSINLLTTLLLNNLDDDTKRQLRDLTIERHDEATYFGLPDDVEFCDNFDAEKAARV
jgi:hypothetical protein